MIEKSLKNAGLKVTGPRVRILGILKDSPNKHFSVGDILFSLRKLNSKSVSLATIYRVLIQFENAGLLVKHNFEGDHFTFELKNGCYHDHILCIKCGLVTAFLDREIKERQQDISKKHGFRMIEHSSSIKGICRTCLSKE